MDLTKITFKPSPTLDSGSLIKRESHKHRPMVSLIIPTLNEAKNLPFVLPLIPMDWVDEIVLVDGRSTDGTVEIARQIIPSIKVVIETEHGKGAALYSGYMASRGDILVVMDADGSHDPREIPRFITPLLEGADMVKGSRFSAGGGTTDMPRIRKWGNGWFVRISNFLFSKEFTDLCYGFHAFWSYCLEKLDLESVNGFEIDTSLYLQAVRNNYHLVEVPSFEGYRFHGIGKLKTFPDGFRVLRTIAWEWLASLRQREIEQRYGYRGLLPRTMEGDSTEMVPSTESQERLAYDLRQLFGQVLCAHTRPDEVFEGFLKHMVDVFDAQSVSIFLLNDNGNVECAYLIYGRVFLKYDASHISDLFQDGLAGWVFRNKQPAIVKDTLQDSRWIKREWDQSQVQLPRAAMAVPLSQDGEIAAVLTMVRNMEGTFTEADLKNVNEVLNIE